MTYHFIGRLRIKGVNYYKVPIEQRMKTQTICRLRIRLQKARKDGNPKIEEATLFYLGKAFANGYKNECEKCGLRLSPTSVANHFRTGTPIKCIDCD